MRHRISTYLVISVMLVAPCYAQTVVGWGDSLTNGDGQTPWTTQFTLLSGIATLNRGVGGNTSTQISDRFNAEPLLHGDFTVIWAGRNDYSDPITVEANIASMVAQISAPYLILGVINGNYGGYEIAGGVGYNYLTHLNSDLASIYGTRFIDVRTLLVNSYNPSNAQDVIDYGNDIVPSSLRIDNIHLTSAGYGIVANAVYSGYLASVPEPAATVVWMGSAVFLIIYVRRIRKVAV